MRLMQGERVNEGKKSRRKSGDHLVQHLGPLLEAGSKADEHLLHTLRESGQAIINAQTEWMRRWTKDLADR